MDLRADDRRSGCAGLARGTKSGAVLIVALLAVLEGNPAAAQERRNDATSESGSAGTEQIWIEPPPRPPGTFPWYPQPLEQRRVRIEEFGPETIRFVASPSQGQTPAPIGSQGGGEVQTLRADRIAWVERTAASEREMQGLRSFAARDYGAALPALIDAVGTRPPVWHQQWLSMVAAQAAWRSSRSEIALELISQIDRRPFPPTALGWLPIQWHNAPTPPDAVSAAARQLSNPSPVVQLVAASWLLGSNRGQATQVLRYLSEDEARPSLAKLATCLLWRTASPPEVRVSSPRWRSEIESLPMVLRPGPAVLLLDKYTAVGMKDEARRLRMMLRWTPPCPHPDLPDAEADDAQTLE